MPRGNPAGGVLFLRFPPPTPSRGARPAAAERRTARGMASKWLRNAKRRARENFLQTIGAHTRLEDPGFKSVKVRFETLSRRLTALHHALKSQHEALEALCNAQLLTARAVRELSYTMGVEPLEYTEALGAIEGVLRPAVRLEYVRAVLPPASRLLERLPEIEELLKKRHRRHLDLDSYRSRAENPKYQQDQTAWEALQQKLSQAERAVQSMTEQILEAVEELEEERPDALMDVIAGLLACQTHFMGSADTILANVLPAFPKAAVPLCRLHQETDRLAEEVSAAHDLLTPMSAVPDRAWDPPAQEHLSGTESEEAEKHLGEKPYDDLNAEAEPLQRTSSASGASEPMAAPREAPPPPPPPPKTPQAPVQSAMVVAVFGFQRLEQGDLGFCKGEVIEVLCEASCGWWYGKKWDSASGAFVEGIFPGNHTAPQL